MKNMCSAPSGNLKEIKMNIPTKLATLTALVFSSLVFTAHATSVQLSPMDPNFIRNGIDVPEGDRPYQVYLYTKTTNGVEGRCGGAIIDRQWVLTAAHCVDEDRYVYKILAGSSNLGSRNIQNLEPDGSFIHPRYEMKTDANDNVTKLRHDIALIRLKSPTSLPALRLPTQKIWDETISLRSSGVASGWGLIQDQPEVGTQIMQQATMEITDFDFDVPGLDVPGVIYSLPLVGGTQNGICSGDSGGPLTVAIGGVDYSVGIASLSGAGCTPSFFTNVGKYLDWIQQAKISSLTGDSPMGPSLGPISSGWGVRDIEYCQAPYNHVVTGFGGRINNSNRVTTIRLQVRAILSDGGLGPARIKRCGSSPNTGMERFVTLPDGYVMTGFAAHSQKNNFVGVTAYGKLYDPNSQSLVGQTVKRYHGTQGAEVEHKPTNNDWIITGLGLRVYKSNFRGYKVDQSGFNGLSLF